MNHMETFHDLIASFYEALAEEKLDQLADSLLSLRDAANTLKNSPEESIFQEMVQDCETKAHGKGELAFNKLNTLNTMYSMQILRKSNEDFIKQLEKMDQQLREMLNGFYTSNALNEEDEKSKNIILEYLKLDLKQRTNLRLEKLKKLKTNSIVNSNGYIDRTIHLETLDGIIHDVSYLVNQADEIGVPISSLVDLLHPIVVTSLLDGFALYAGDARLTAWEKKISMRSHENSTQVEPDESLQMIDLLLEELSCILQISFHYTSYIASLLGHSLSNGDLSIKIQELNGIYLVMERFYIFQTVHKAVIIAEPQEIEPNIFVISSVEDVPFVLDKAFHRANQSKNYHTVLSIIIAIVEALDSMYMPSILNLPQRNFEIPLPIESPKHENSSELTENELSFSDAILQAVDADLTHQFQIDAKMMMAINSGEISWNYIGKIKKRINELKNENFINLMPSIFDCLPKSFNELKNEFQLVHTTGVKSLYENKIKNYFFNLFNQSKIHWQYQLSLQDYDYLEINGSPLVILIQTLLKDKSLGRFRRGLSQNTFETFWRQVVTDWCKWIENGVQNKNFNEIGAMQFEKDVRHISILSSQFPLHGEVSLRNEFTRLDQIVLLVNLSKASDVLEYDSIRSHLSNKEIESRLGLRFRSESIQLVMQELKK